LLYTFNLLAIPHRYRTIANKITRKAIEIIKESNMNYTMFVHWKMQFNIIHHAIPHLIMDVNILNASY